MGFGSAVIDCRYRWAVLQSGSGVLPLLEFGAEAACR
jgi:hypothetical protein